MNNENTSKASEDLKKKVAILERKRIAARRNADRADWIGNDPPDRT